MNNVQLIGRVGNDVEVRFIGNGTAVCEINLAVNDGFGENRKTVWLGVTVWGKTAEVAGKYVSKGDQIGISGRLTQDEWEDKTTGKKQRKTKVTASDLHLLGGGKASGPEARQPREARVDGAPTGQPGRQDEEDIPF